jgi:hypothetical protein
MDYGKDHGKAGPSGVIQVQLQDVGKGSEKGILQSQP